MKPSPEAVRARLGLDVVAAAPHRHVFRIKGKLQRGRGSSVIVRMRCDCGAWKSEPVSARFGLPTVSERRGAVPPPRAGSTPA